MAQFGLERLLWEQEVVGSSPTSPIGNNKDAPVAQLDRATAFKRSLYAKEERIEWMRLYARKPIKKWVTCRQPGDSG